MGKDKTIHVSLAPNALVDLDDYRYVSRKSSRSDTITSLVHLALHVTLPNEHIQRLQKIAKIQQERSPEERALIQKKNWDNRERIHITFSEVDEGRVQRYRELAKEYDVLKEKTGTRAETIRYLCGLVFEGKFPEEHVQVIEKRDEEIKRRAEKIWDAERIPGRDQENFDRAEEQLAIEAAHRRRTGDEAVGFRDDDREDGNTLRA